MWYRSKWARGQAILRSSSTVIPSDPNCISLLIQELCSKHIGKLELQVSKKEPQEYFNKSHIPFCRLGTRKGSVSDHEAFIAHVQENKMIDLILDYDAFHKNSLHEEECAGDEEDNDDEDIKIIPKRSTTTISLESRASTPSIVSTLLTPESRRNSMAATRNPSVQEPNVIAPSQKPLPSLPSVLTVPPYNAVQSSTTPDAATIINNGTPGPLPLPNHDNSQVASVEKIPPCKHHNNLFFKKMSINMKHISRDLESNSGPTKPLMATLWNCRSVSYIPRSSGLFLD